MSKLNKEELIKGVCITLDNFENVRDDLDTIPYKEYLDLYVTYNLFIDDNGSVETKKVTRADLENVELDDEELYRVALGNTMRMFPPKIDRLDNIINGLLDKFNGDMDSEDIPVTPYLYLSNINGFYGSPVILYDKLLCKISELLEDDYYIIPSSIHEYLIVSETSIDNNVDWLIFMVRDVNRTCLDKETILSNNVYHYCRKSNKLSVIIK